MVISMLKIRRPLGRLIFNMGIAIPGKTVFLIETAPWTYQIDAQSITWSNVDPDLHCYAATKGCNKLNWTNVRPLISFNSSPPGQNGKDVADDIFRSICEWKILYFD